MNFYFKIKALMDSRNLSEYRVSKDLGINQSTFTRWRKNGYNPSFELLQKLSEYFNVPASYFLGTEEIKNYENKIPILGIVPCGEPIEAVEDIIGYLDVYPGQVKNHFGLKAKGDSMYPFICNKDTLVVKQCNVVDNGKIAIVKVNGDEATCKKILIDENGITLVPLNISYNPVHYSKQEIESKPVVIIGEVVEVRRTL